MIPEIIEDRTFTKVNTEEVTNYKQFEHCRFVNCDFSYANLGGIVFMDCRFDECNLSVVKLSDTGIQNVVFKYCKLSGADFSKSRDFLFEAGFDNCILDNAIFYKKKNKGAKFINCSMIETDFTEADLTNTEFDSCNLSRAFFDRTILKNADFRTSYNFTIDPDNNDIKKARFSVNGLPGLLTRYDIRIEE
jgi:uncharacterized protein YjbI with pentapeptide repeats